MNHYVDSPFLHWRDTMQLDGKWAWGIVSPFISYDENLKNLKEAENDLLDPHDDETITEDALKRQYEILEYWKTNGVFEKYKVIE